MDESKQASDKGGVKELNNEEHSQQDANFKQMHEEILEAMTSMISKLERTRDKSQELANMKSLYAVITSSKKKLKLETLMQFNKILKSLREKIDKVTDIQEYSSAGAEQGNITIGGELAKIPTRKEKRQSAVHVPNIITENHSSNLQAGKSNSSDDDKPSPNNEWLPSHKNSTVLQLMLEVGSLLNLYKCMDNNCDGTPFDLVQHITKKHGHCQFQCPYCFFRGVACIYLVMHQNTKHINKLAKVLLCTDVKVSPPAESELEPLASVVQPYICDQGSCNKKFYNPKDFQLHLQWQHNQVSTLTCHICKATHQNAAHLISHYRFHSFSLYQCRHCPYGAEKEEDILLHLCNIHHNLPALTVMRHYELTTMSPPGDVNQLKIVDLDDVSSRPSEAAVVAGGVMTSTESQTHAEEGAAVKNQAGHTLCCQVAESEIIDTVQNNSFEMVDNRVTEATQESAVSPISGNVSLQKSAPLMELKVSSSFQETNVEGEFSDCSTYREQNADSDDDDVDKDDDVQVLYCQLSMKSKQCNHMTGNGSCKLRKSQPGKKYLDNKMKNCVNELVKETDSQNSCDSVMSLTESCTGAAAKEESELTQEHTTCEAFPVSTTFSSKIPIENAERRFSIDSHPETNCSAESVNITCGADKAQTNQASEESAVTEAIVTQGDQRKQFTASGLSGEDLYLCGNSHCEYRARTGYQLQEHLYICDLSHDHVLRCPHCSQPFKASNRLVNHLRIHGSPRYSCPLCTYRAVAATAVAKHLKLQHKVSYIETVPIDRFLNNRAMHMFAVRPQGKGKSKHKQTVCVAKTVYGPEEIHLLPMSAILKDPIECSVCSFKTKVCSRMKRHMGQHLNPDVDSAEISRMEALHPVPCLEANGKMFDKMAGVAISSNIAFPKAVAAGAVVSPCKSRKEVQDAASASTSQPVKREAAVRARASIHDLAEPSPSDSPVSSPKGSGPKRVAAVRARASIRDLAEPILYDSPVSSPESLGIEEPVVENKWAFTSSSEKEKGGIVGIVPMRDQLNWP
ncbi:uncharacterized protein LOC126291440 [Schistocerca gregaria]|uniref:uncharacterized protein LOC126291440 n=1 Tax=Schistocerca gregaria TaxID=7010 RepID=UPI00211DAF7A|nr:uncharacterized protein LOC126291440 [Schistocerca gregaria]